MNKRFLVATLMFVLLSSLVVAVYPDPGHPASDIGGGTFYADNFTFPQNVNVTGILYTDQMCLNGDCQTNWDSGWSNTTTLINSTIGLNVSVDQGVLFVDATNNYVGVNTTTPNATLTVDGNIQIIGDLYATGSKAGFLADEVRNADVQELEPGDLVSISFDDAVEYLPGRSVPIFNVIKSGPQNKLDVVGVVYKKSPYADRQSAGTSILPGDQLIIATQNAVSFLKVTTENGPIVPGDYLTPGSTPGYAMKADTNSVLIVGRALDTLASGVGQIGAFISIGMKDPYTDINAERLVELPVVPTKLANLGITKPTQSTLGANAPADRRIAALEAEIAALRLLISNIPANSTPTNSTPTNQTTEPAPIIRTEHGIVIQLS